MSTALRIGPFDHGREITDEEFESGDFEEGHKYELIDGRIYVSPQANSPHDVMEEYIHEELIVYRRQHRDIVKRLSRKARVFVPGVKRTTSPEPDFAIYRDRSPDKKVRWQQISPFIVVEIVSEGDPDKDYVRNVELYRRVPSILEYWVFDKLEEEDGPVLKVYRRDTGNQDWTITDYDATATYAMPLLPGFSLPVTPEEW